MNQKIPADLLTQIQYLRQDFHRNPELSQKEFRTTAIIKEFLLQRGIRILPTEMETGVIAEIGEGEGPIIGLRADIDALPITEITDLPYKSIHENVMHACGHDFHMASLLGAAILLKQKEEILSGRIRLIFQPAEEIFAGAQAVIKTGLIQDLHAIIGYHNDPSIAAGTYGIRKNQLMASVDRFQVIIHGKGTHAAAPHLGSDPIVTASQIINMIQAIISRYVGPSDPAVLSVTHIIAGDTWNVIPDRVFFEGTVRTYSQPVREQILELVDKIIQNTCDDFQQSAEIKWLKGPPAIENDSDLTELFERVLPNIGTTIVPEASMAGEDFAYYQEIIPSLFIRIGTGKGYPLHHPGFLVNDEVLPQAITYFVEGSLALLKYYTET
ncbi:amidohydrolase [Enterococcus dongliensis]|uniref:amidohydrolase n=1 Tax=Enterococcus dongliensis TaxID=2559925 RepID=UPI0028907FA7|nr:amidohydrolase [Enterococcus dongliensis]MDT2612476.1 amidohydrolase [Enterococcus dongliensis]